VPGTLSVAVLLVALFTDILDIHQVSWSVKTVAPVLCFPVAVGGFVYLSKAGRRQIPLLIGSIFPFASLGVFAFFVSIFEWLEIAGGKGPIFFSIFPTVLVCMFIMYAFRKHTFQKGA
jgi:hypothetical protein